MLVLQCYKYKPPIFCFFSIFLCIFCRSPGRIFVVFPPPQRVPEALKSLNLPKPRRPGGDFSALDVLLGRIIP